MLFWVTMMGLPRSNRRAPVDSQSCAWEGARRGTGCWITWMLDIEGARARLPFHDLDLRGEAWGKGRVGARFRGAEKKGNWS